MNGSTEGNAQGPDGTASARARPIGETHWTRFLYRDAVGSSRDRRTPEEKGGVRARRRGPLRWLLRQRRRSRLGPGATLLGRYVVAHLAVGAVLRVAWWAVSAAPDAAQVLLRVHDARFPLL